MELLTALGVDWKTFIAQLVNFLILYWILRKFALGKIIGFIQKRQDEIDSGVKNAQLAQQALDQAKTQQEEILTNARKKAKNIIGEAKQLGQIQEEKIVQEAKEKAKKIIDSGERQVKVAKEKMILEAKSELTDIITIGLKNLITEKNDPSKISHQYLESGMKA